MALEVIVEAKTVEEAIELGCEKLGLPREEVEIEILELPKKGLFGKLKTEAKVRVYQEADEEKPRVPEQKTPAAETKKMPASAADQPKKKIVVSSDKVEAAQKYLTAILSAMGLDAVEQKIEETESGVTITLEGEHLGVIIGRRGETLDAIQYLVSLAANMLPGDYLRITVDCGNFRAKREETLRGLAARISKSVVRTGRSTTLEPMNPYERRIIHSVVTEIEGVTSKSTGEEPNRRVVISSTNPRSGGRGRNDRDRRSGGRGPRRDNRQRDDHTSSAQGIESNKAVEPKKDDAPGGLYSKIEL